MSHEMENVPRGSVASVKRVDRYWKSMEWQLKPTGNEEAEAYDEHAILIRRNFTWDKKYESTSVVVNSKDLRAVLLDVLDNVKGVSIVDEIPELDSDTLFLYLPEIKEQAKSLTSVQAEHCALLVDYLEMDYQSKKDRLFPMLASGIITFDLVWALFKPGTIAVMRMDLFDDLQCFEVDYVTLHESEKKQHKAHYRIEGHTLAHDGKKFGYYDMQVELPRFKGTRQITKLAVYPLDYCGEPIETRTRLLNRGAKFVILQGVHTQSYDGQAVLPDKSRSVYIDGRIVIDKVGYKRSHAPVADASFNALGTGHDTFTEEQLLIASPLVSGFSLHRNRWFHFLVSKVKDVEWSDPFPSVVLPDSIKQSVEGLISAHNQHSSKVVKDIVEGKGDGVVLVLHGPSGCGKTLTAEAVAERLRVPLYSISAGELGEKPADLAENIRDIFELAHSWQAVLLVDEADALLEERRRGDTKRNAMVSTLLRSLEQYRGVMIMTTNYVDRFDTALSSRVHLFVEYKRLGRPDRKRLWAFCISRATDYKINFEDDDLEDLSKEELNAREIKNITKVAHSTALLRDTALSSSHVFAALKAAKQFRESSVNLSLYN